MSDLTQVERMVQLFAQYWVRDHGQASLDALQGQTGLSGHDQALANALMAEAFIDVVGIELDVHDGVHQKIWAQAWEQLRLSSKHALVAAEQGVVAQSTESGVQGLERTAQPLGDVKATIKKLLSELEILLPHVLHYASFSGAHSSAHRDVANARKLMTEVAGAGLDALNPEIKQFDMAPVDALARLIEQAYKSGEITESTDYFSSVVCNALGISNKQMRAAMGRESQDRNRLVRDPSPKIKMDVVFGDAPEPIGALWRNMASLENTLAALIHVSPPGTVVIKNQDAWVLRQQGADLVLHHATYADGKLTDLFSRFDQDLGWVDSDETELQDYNDLLQRAIDEFAVLATPLPNEAMVDQAANQIDSGPSGP